MLSEFLNFFISRWKIVEGPESYCLVHFWLHSLNYPLERIKKLQQFNSDLKSELAIFLRHFFKNVKSELYWKEWVVLALLVHTALTCPAISFNGQFHSLIHVEWETQCVRRSARCWRIKKAMQLSLQSPRCLLTFCIIFHEMLANNGSKFVQSNWNLFLYNFFYFIFSTLCCFSNLAVVREIKMAVETFFTHS